MNCSFSSITDQIVEAGGLLAKPNRNRLFIDVRLGDPELELKSYRECHIFGAVHAQIRDVFASPPTPESGNLPLPDMDQLQQTLDGWGVNSDTEVVLYGPSPALASRGWWVLKWAGLKNVKVLDGGLKAWINHGGAVAQGDSRPRLEASGSRVMLTPRHMPSITVAEVEALGDTTLLVDARDEASWLAGCIPRAANLPASEQWTPGSTLRTTQEVRQIYTDAGITPERDVVVYCGGGVLSALSVLTMSSLGITPRLFVGSWSEWSKSPQRMARSASERTHA